MPGLIFIFCRILLNCREYFTYIANGVMGLAYRLRCRFKEIRMKEFMIDSKTEFARMLEVGARTYTNWENETSFPELKEAYRVANKVGKKVDDIWYLEIE